MPEAIGGPLNDKETEPQAVGSHRVEPEKWFEYRCQFVGRDTLAVIAHLDPKCRSMLATADEDTATGRRVIERIAREIAQHTVEQHGLAHDHDVIREDTQIDATQPLHVMVTQHAAH